MPHQWFIWKALLDCGRAEEARKIAHTALRIWRDEVEASGRCFEHFIVEGGRGAGWHQFSGLSCPVLNWFSAYHRPGRITGGFNTHFHSVDMAPNASGITASISISGQSRHTPCLVAVLKPDRAYTVCFNSQPLNFSDPFRGTLEIILPAKNASGLLRIVPVSPS